jgi:hypothetical protein
MVDFGNSWSSKNSDSPLIRLGVSMDPLAWIFPGLGDWKIKTSDKLQNWVSDNIAKNDPFINLERKYGPSHWFKELRPISDWAVEKPLDATGLVVGGVVGAGALAGAGGAAGAAGGGASGASGGGGAGAAGGAGLWEGAFAGTQGLGGAAYGAAPAAGIPGIAGPVGGATGAAAGGVSTGTWLNAGGRALGAAGAAGGVPAQQQTPQQMPSRPRRHPTKNLNGRQYVQIGGKWYLEG